MILGRVRVNIEYVLDRNGIIIDCYYTKRRKSENIVFPLNKNTKIIKDLYNDPENLELLGDLEELWLEDIVGDYEDKYIISYENIYRIDKEILENLNLFKEEKIKIDLKSVSHLGVDDFNIAYNLNIENIGPLGEFYGRVENVIKVDDDIFLLDKEQWSLINEIDAYEASDRKNQGLFLSKVKQKAESAGAGLDNYLENENCILPSELDVGIEEHSDLRLELHPFFNDIDKKYNEELANLDDFGEMVSLSESSKRSRLFFEKDTYDKYRKINRNKEILGSDVPRFLKNPSEYLPEGYDIETFSDRVRGLKVKTYKGQPFVNFSEDDEGWFQFDAGVKLQDEKLDEESQITNEEFKDLVEKAKDAGEDYVYYEDKWVEVDRENGEDFARAEEDMRNKFSDKKVQAKDISYVLDIFDNLGRLEYSPEYISIKERNINESLFEYKKPSLLDAELYTYQQEGYLWLKSLREQSLGGLLADDMGLGKTMQVIAYMANLKENNRLKPTIIVVPKSLVENWENEISKFISFKKLVYKHMGGDRVKDENYIKTFDIVITTYDILVRDQLILGKINWQTMIIDEAQKIKNSSTLYSSAAKAMKAEHVIALTGTPVENNLSELWSIVDFVQPGLLDSYSVFKERFQNPIEKNLDNIEVIDQISDELIATIRPIFLRRTKKEKLKDLPSKIIKHKYCQLGEEQLKLYGETIENNRNDKRKGQALKYLQELLMLSSHPNLISKAKDEKASELIKKCPKLQMTLDILRDIKNKKEKVIVFTRFKDMQSILRSAIYAEFNMSVSLINGDVTDKRLDIIREFEEKDGFNILILSPRAAGTGLNIVGANHVIHYTREWNPAVENQATDRVYRIGQNKDVYVYYPITIVESGISVEAKLNDLLEQKTLLSDEVIIPMEKTKVTGEELLEGVM